MTFNLSLDMDNAAFVDAPSGAELARILRALADRLDGEPTPAGSGGKLRDVNGNTCGDWRVSD